MQVEEIDNAAYEIFVKSLAKPADEILSSLSALTAELTHMAMGVAGEAGELVDAIKKHAIYNKPLDRENIIEELGDLDFFITRLCQILNITRDEYRAKNIEKLGKRYPGGYSDAKAQARADKAGVQ